MTATMTTTAVLIRDKDDVIRGNAGGNPGYGLCASEHRVSHRSLPGAEPASGTAGTALDPGRPVAACRTIPVLVILSDRFHPGSVAQLVRAAES